MSEQMGGEWAELRESILDAPELRREYERTRQSVLRVRHLLQQLDAERERAGLSKAALAERIGADPSIVRRLFSSGASNPTLKTVLEIAGALGMEVDLRPTRSRPAAAGRALDGAAAA